MATTPSGACARVLPRSGTALVEGAGGTAHTERFNAVPRQRPGRFVRETLSFTGATEGHEAGPMHFIHRCNRDRR